MMLFLMGLNEEYEFTKSQILLYNPLPNLAKTYGMIANVEKQRKLQILDNVLALIQQEIGKALKENNGNLAGVSNMYHMEAYMADFDHIAGPAPGPAR
ncbi:hypothetical protein LIER_14796 [Lithospermum erythrorhizon]|uniref:Uncharacterized protein n=1 Tax=Lithospermum erythrorhizon TaxID=34254 RepID=A0AAV3Q4I7_LITER